MTSFRAAVVLAFVMGASPCAAVYPPAPPPRPPEFRDPITKPTLSETPQPPPRPAGLVPDTAKPEPRSPSPVLSPLAETDPACDALLASGLVVAVRLASVVGTGGCGIAAPVSLKAIILADKRRVDLAPAPTMRCMLAAQVASWIVEDVAPLLEGNGGKIVRLANADSYDCRGRNGVIGAKLSAHGTGDALDLDAVQFFDGRSIRFADKTNDMDIAVGLRTTACARFSTVLGPGSDGFHESHVHVDLEARHNGGKICEWDLR